MHELAHIKRGDLWVSFIQTTLQILYFYNPLLWLANAIIRKVREQAVDEMVLVAMGSQAEDYPDTLLNVSKLTFRRPALSLRLIGVVESKSALKTRIKHIVTRPIPKTAKVGIVGFAVLAIMAAVLLPMAGAEKSDEQVEDGPVWGDAVNGLQAAVKFVPEKESYSLGESFEIRYLIQNVSDHDITIVSSQWRQDHLFVEDDKGNDVRVYGFVSLGQNVTVRQTLKPGETAVLRGSGIGFGEPDANILELDKSFNKTICLIGNILRCEPGQYFIHYDLKLPDVSNSHTGDCWRGRVKTGTRKITITPRQEPAVQVEGEGIGLVEAKNHFSTTLPSGVTVELVGVADYPSKGGQSWWQADGTVLAKPPYDGSDIDIMSIAGEDIRTIELAIKLGGNTSGPGWEAPVKRVDGKGVWGDGKGVWGGGRRRENGHIVDDIKSIAIICPNKQEKFDLGLYIAAGPWGDMAIATKNSVPVSSAGVVFSVPQQTVNGTTITVSDSHLEYDSRIIAIDLEDKIYTASRKRFGETSDKIWQTTVGFDLELSKVKEFRFQTRPYELVEFKNVSLQGGYKTDFQVEGAEDWGEAAEGNILAK